MYRMDKIMISDFLTPDFVISDFKIFQYRTSKNQTSFFLHYFLAEGADRI